MMEPREKHSTISIPAQLFQKLQKRVKDTGFGSVSEYVTYVLNEILSEQEEELPLSEEVQEKIKERLKGLGYID